MAFYENVFIARQDISTAAAEALADHFAGVITGNGGTVPKKENWGLRNLTYKIKKNRKGHYVLLNIDGPWQAVQEMERQMRINEDILRFLTVKVEELDPNPSAVLQSRSSRDDRPPRRGGDRRFGEGEDIVPLGGDDAPIGIEDRPLGGRGDVA